MIGTEDGKAKYDAKMKELLANRQVLAWILKRFVPEFADSSLEDIENYYIEPGTILVSKLGVAGRQETIEGIGTEDGGAADGRIYYDVMFRARCPEKFRCEGEASEKQIGLYINLEAQNAYYPGYPIESRGVYYSARKLCAQINSPGPDTNYGSLQKVYSIWLCMGDVPDYEANTVSFYAFDKYDIIGCVERNPDIYDLQNVVILRINDRKEPEDKTLAMLQTLCSNQKSRERKLDDLRNMGFRVDRELAEGVETMCNLSELVERRGIEQGLERGMEAAKRKIALRLLQEGMSLEQASDVVDVPVSQVRKWKLEA